MRVSCFGYDLCVAAAKPFTGEVLAPDLARGSFPEIRFAMLEFVGQYLLDFERAAQAKGLTLAQARVLGFSAMRPMSMREIAEQFGCDPSNITAKVDRLVELGLAERRPDPADGRVKLIAATAAGVQASSELCDSREWLARVLGGLDTDQIATVRAAFDLLVGS
jgi:DNA-binding MarR family transcriptional regulator